MIENEHASDPTEPNRVQKSPRFVSWRWRLTFPLSIVVMIVAMAGAYVLASQIGGGVAATEQNTLRRSAQAVGERSAELFDFQRTEARRVAFTLGIPEAIQTGQTDSLHPMLEGIGIAADLDSLIVTDAAGHEVMGLLRTETAEFTDYTISTETDLSQEAIVRAVLDEALVGATGLLRTPDGLLLYTAVPIELEDGAQAVALVGQRLDRVLADIKASAIADVTLYGLDGILLQTTYPIADTSLVGLSLDDGIRNQTLSEQVIVESLLAVDGAPYRVAYAPFQFGPMTLGITATLLPDTVPFATSGGQQITALVASVIVAGVVIAGFVAISVMLNRVERVTEVATALAQGQQVRTGLEPTDEIGQAGVALDQYADVVKKRQEQMRETLRKQRRQRSHLFRILEAMPDGVVVQDKDGRVLLMNDNARKMLGSQRIFRSAGIHELGNVVQDVLGATLAPGIYALGDPQKISLDDRMLSAQAAAVTSSKDRRLGTVIMLRDISDQVQQEQTRDAQLTQMSTDIQQSLSGLAHSGAGSPNTLVNAFAREISRHAASLQAMIMEMRELTHYNQKAAKKLQRAISLETLIWSVANDWQQIARVAKLTMQVIIQEKNLHTLGDEQRLRWAIGDIVDNAIKYTPPGGMLTLEIRGQSEGMVNLRVRDSGVGIAADDLTNIFMQFYRGTPVTKDGEIIRVPGMGQGLTTARQILEAHGGKVQVKSTLHVGTAVYFSLPLTSAVSYELPLIDEDAMEGATFLIPEDVELFRDDEDE